MKIIYFIILFQILYLYVNKEVYFNTIAIHLRTSLEYFVLQNYHLLICFYSFFFSYIRLNYQFAPSNIFNLVFFLNIRKFKKITNELDLIACTF